jgi:hypothetical protein
VVVVVVLLGKMALKEGEKRERKEGRGNEEHWGTGRN